MKHPTAGLLSSRSHKHRSGKAPASSRRQPPPSGLSPDELLAKIDALDWDETVSPNSNDADNAPTLLPHPDGLTSIWRVAAIVATLICALAVLYFVLTPDSPPRPRTDSSPLPIATGGPSGTAAGIPSQPVPEEGLAAVTAADERRVALYAQAVQHAELEVQRKAETQRKARVAERARTNALQRDRRRQDELRAERAAEAARAAKAREEAAQPKGPASPQELCAGEGNLFSRGFCEARACGKPEWRNHPFCIKRLEQQVPGFGQGG